MAIQNKFASQNYVTETATEITNIAVNDNAASILTEKLIDSYADTNPAPNDLLEVWLGGERDVSSMQPSSVSSVDASTLINSPVTSGAFYATRTVEYSLDGHVTVRLRESYPQNGRIWSNMYDKNLQIWLGWKATATEEFVNSRITPITQGGTQASDRATAIWNLTLIGYNLFTPADDTTTNWISLGNGMVWYTETGHLNNQPSQYGILENRVIGATEVHQIWKEQPSGKMYYRAGNASGWSSSWTQLATVDGTRKDFGNVSIWTDNEGGNIEIRSQHGVAWQIDASAGDSMFRIYNFNANGEYKSFWINREGKFGGEGFVDSIYPVGSIYLAYNHTSPASLFGGSWTRLSNTFLWACDEHGVIGATGGSVTHTLTANEMPSHGNHLYTWHPAGSGNATGKYLSTLSSYGDTGRGWNNYSNEFYPEGLHLGGNQAHNNMPPYTHISAWRRVS